jgi:hypothetical protein
MNAVRQRHGKPLATIGRKLQYGPVDGTRRGHSGAGPEWNATALSRSGS